MLNPVVTKFLDALHHPLRPAIEALRKIILKSDPRLAENIKWNGPNYSVNDEDRITMKIHPPKQVQLIFHRGVRKLEQPSERIIEETTGLLSWREKDRAIASFKNLSEVENASLVIISVIEKWLKATA